MLERLWMRSSSSRSHNLKSKIQNLKLAGFLAVFLVVGVGLAQAQQPKKLSRIGILFGSTPSANSRRIEAFRQGMRELGYVEGKNIVIESRYAEGKFDRLPDLAAELVRLKVDVIVSGGQTPTRAAKEATNTIPLVMANDRDPVGSGFVASLARPGGNITGLSNLASELNGKRLELLKEIVPKLSRVAVLGTSSAEANAESLRETELVATAFGVQLQYLDVLISQRTQIVELAAKNRLPATYNQPEYVEAGGLMTYGVNLADLYRRAATYVDKILKGAKPADLPVEQPKKFEFIINLKAAKQINLTIPPNVLARADKVIK